MNIPEILVANGTGAVLVCFLFLLRVRGESKNSVGSELFCRMLVVTLLAQATETISFLLDGVPGAASRFWLYLTNTVCTGATVCVAAAQRLFNAPECGQVLRVKGFAPAPAGGWLELNATAAGCTLAPIPQGQEVVIVIGEALDKAAIEANLKG